jgi:hypothetical protein
MARARQKGISKPNSGNGRAQALKREARIEADDGYGAWYKQSLLPAVLDAGRDGLSETQIAVYVFDVPRSTMRKMARARPELQRALDKARDLAKAWWESQGQIRLRTPNFNTHLFNKLVSCRFRDDYSDRVTIEGDDDKPIIHKVERVIVRASKTRAQREG